MSYEDENRTRLGKLVMEAIDDLIARYGSEVKLEDAILIYDVSLPSDDEDNQETEICSRCTSHRVAVGAGLATMYVTTQVSGMRSEEP